MKFILSLFALVLFFGYALIDATKSIHYRNQPEAVITTGNRKPTQVADLSLAQETTKKEKAGFSL